MTSERVRMGLPLWLWWIFAVTVAFAFSLVANGLVNWRFYGALGFAAAGGVAGLIQWLALPDRFVKGSWWVWASILGWGLGFAALWYLFIGDYNPLLAGLAGGLIVGLVQWFEMRARVKNATWWLLANLLGWALGFWIGEYLGSSIHAVVGFPVFGIIVGLVTGGTMVWLLKE